MAMAETAAFLGFIAPGEFTIILGGVLAGEGTLSIELLIGIVWASIVVGRLDRVHARAPARARVRRSSTATKVRLTRGALREGRGVLRATRRQDDLLRPLARLRAAADALHRRRVGDALPPLPPLRRPERRAVGGDLLPAGLHLLAQLRAGHEHRGPRRDRVRRAGRRCSSAATGVQAPAPPRAAAAVRGAGSSARRERPVLRPAGVPSARALWLVLLRPLWRYVLRPLWLLIAPPLRFLWARLTPGRARHRAHDAARGRGRRDLHGRAADRPDRDADAAAARATTTALRHRARHRDGLC